MADTHGQTRRAEVLADAALTLASELSLPAVLQKIVGLAAHVVDARYGALGVLGPDGRVIQEFLTYGMTDEERRAIGPLPHGHGILGVLISDAQPLRLPRIQDDPRSVGFPPNHPPMTTFLGVPIAIRGEVFGNLYLTEKAGGAPFTAEDEDAVVKLAAHAAVAIDNARIHQQARQAQRRLAAVNEIANTILEGKSSDEVLRLIARHARELLGARIATLVTPTTSAGTLTVRAASGEDAEAVEGTEFPSEQSISGEIMRTRTAVLVEDTSKDPRVHQPLVRLGNMGPALFVPLAVPGRVFGTLGIANHPGDPAFRDEELIVAGTFAAQASVALEHARIQGELKRLAVVEDRERIAKELHDDIIQSLFAEGMALQAAIAMTRDPEAVQARLSQAVENIDRVIRDLRNYIFGLRPGIAADRQLEQSLRDLAAGYEESANVSFEVTTDPDVVSLLAGRSAEILQVAREAISNAVRHSGADRVSVSLMRTGDYAMLEIADNGKGFDPEQATGRGQGLVNLAARAESLGGEFHVESEPGHGTWVRITMSI